MCMIKRAEKNGTEKMSDTHFRMMIVLFKIIDFIYPYIKRRVRRFGIEEGMTVVDYGCGPGRYAVEFARIVGDEGKVYAVDIHDMAVEGVRKRIQKRSLKNVEPVLVRGYESSLPDGVADVVCAIDMFFIIQNPTAFLGELKRITKRDGTLVIDDGHQPREKTKRKLHDSGHWEIVEETRDHLKCRPK
jgi:ubiquinone/menaquinone biosynthesis C-methylase UbiE